MPPQRPGPADAPPPIDPGLDTHASVRHLLTSRESLGLQLVSQQTLAFYCWLMHEAQAAIRKERFGARKDEIQPRVSRRL